MTDSTRRDFIATGAALLGAASLTAVAGAQGAPPAGEALLKALVPGAIDAEGKWALPPLPYAVEALEPHIDAQTMQIHHDKHHAGYVKGLTAAEEAVAAMRAEGKFDLVDYWTGKLSFNGGGHFLHCIFWDCMGPNGGGSATGLLGEHIKRDFGSFEAFQGLFSAAAKSVEGSGWGILGYQAASGRLTVLQGRNQNLLSQWGVIPILAIDVWEHAYYLKYQNRRADYVTAWWNTIDWQRVNRRYGVLHHQS